MMMVVRRDRRANLKTNWITGFRAGKKLGDHQADSFILLTRISREDKWLAQIHTGSNWQSQDWNPGLLLQIQSSPNYTMLTFQVPILFKYLKGRKGSGHSVWAKKVELRSTTTTKTPQILEDKLWLNVREKFFIHPTPHMPHSSSTPLCHFDL